MSIALDNGSTNRMEGSGFIRGMSCISMFDSPELLHGDRGFSVADMARPATMKVGEEREEDLDSSSSSSIGRNSDLSGRSSDGDDSGDTEVQSSYKGGPLDSMDALEEVLPIRRGISRFYSGKSKSFASLADASSSSSVKDIAKPENAYSRKRRNLLACSHVWDKNRSFPLRSNGGGISKRMANSSRSTLALVVAMTNSQSNINTNDDSNSNSRTSPLLPPLHPQARPSHINVSSSPRTRRNFTPGRSFSLADLQHCAVASTTARSHSVISDTARS